MSILLPYLATPGSLKTALEKIKSAATPERVTGDFVTTKLSIKGGTGRAIPPYLKKIGFVAPDGTPTEIYKRFRNHATSGIAVADAVMIGYQELSQANEYFYELTDKDLLALIVQVTGAEANSQVAKLTLSAIKTLKSFADFEAKHVDSIPAQTQTVGAESIPFEHRVPPSSIERRLGLNLSYTINLNLPATSDQAVFNAIFRSLKEHLISSDE